jgi:hypothetical protein
MLDYTGGFPRFTDVDIGDKNRTINIFPRFPRFPPLAGSEKK